MYSIAVSNEQSALILDEERLRSAVRMVLERASIRTATISLAIVEDTVIHKLNHQYLGHDCATDVLSFVLERNGSSLDGEVIVSAETAVRAATDFGWTASDELLLYVIHGMLHMVGYDDRSPQGTEEMRTQEREILSRFDVRARYDVRC